jgi:hypothetical protein
MLLDSPGCITISTEPHIYHIYHNRDPNGIKLVKLQNQLLIKPSLKLQWPTTYAKAWYPDLLTVIFGCLTIEIL